MSASTFSAKGSEAVGLFCATCITCVCIREISQKMYGLCMELG